MSRTIHSAQGQYLAVLWTNMMLFQVTIFKNQQAYIRLAYVYQNSDGKPARGCLIPAQSARLVLDVEIPFSSWTKFATSPYSSIIIILEFTFSGIRPDQIAPTRKVGSTLAFSSNIVDSLFHGAEYFGPLVSLYNILIVQDLALSA